MAEDESHNYNVTLKESTQNELLELYPTAINAPDAIRMAIEEALESRRNNRR